MGIHLDVSFESLILAVKHLHPGMGHGTAGLYTEELVGNGAGSAMTAADISSPSAQNCGVGALSPAGTEFQHRPSLCRPNHPVGFGGNQALVVDAQQQIGFYQLGLDRRGANGDDGLLGENRSALGNRPDIAGEPEVRQEIQEILGKHLPAAQVVNVLRVKMQLLNILDNLLQTRSDGESAAVRAAPEKQVKVGYPVCVALREIPLAHGQFVKVAEHGKIQLFVDNHIGHLIAIYWVYYKEFPGK